MADIQVESPAVPTPPATDASVATSATPVADEDDIMAGTALTEQETAAASTSTPIDPPAPAPVPAPREERKKPVVGLDDKKRAKRLFGGLLGTLDSFKKEERQRGASDAAKRRSLINDRIQNKLRTESHVTMDITAKERELKTLRFQIDKTENELVQKSAAFAHRHASLPRLASFLHTAVVSQPLDDTARRNPVPLLSSTASLPPLGQAAFHKFGDKTPRPLFYLPAVLLPEQETKLAEQKTAAETALREEQESWTAKKEALKTEVDELRTKESTLQAELASLRKQKADLDASPVPAPSAFPADRSRSSSVVSSQQQQPVQVQEQQQQQQDETPIGDGMMDVEGDEDVEY